MSRWRAVVGLWRGVGPVWFGANRLCRRAFRHGRVCCGWAGWLAAEVVTELSQAVRNMVGRKQMR